ncbi:MAG: phage holin family protein [Rhodoferax sp.]|nr:phage holin family protein [Rhodoferax sp.]
MTESVEPVQGGGLFVSLRQLLATALEMAQVRLDLFLTEIEQEKLRVFDGLLWAGLALMLIGVGVILLCGFIVMLLWDSYRLVTLGVLTLLFLGAGGLLMRAARNRLRHPSGALGSTVDELRQDLAELKQHNAGE